MCVTELAASFPCAIKQRLMFGGGLGAAQKVAYVHANLGLTWARGYVLKRHTKSTEK